MTTFAVVTPSTCRTPEVGSSKQRAPASTRDLWLRAPRPNAGSLVVHVVGELDVNTAPRVHELLAARLHSGVMTLVVDLSAVRFLGVAGLELLEHVRRCAANRGATLRVVRGPVCVSRAMRAAGYGEAVETCSSVRSALADQRSAAAVTFQSASR